MTQMMKWLTTFTMLVALFFALSTVDGLAQRKPMTTYPGHKKGDPCEDKIESSVKVTPWVLSGLGFLTVQETPIDTTDIVTAAAQLSTALEGNLENFQTVVDTVQGWMANLSFVGYYQWTRTVTIKLKEWKCQDGALILVRDIEKTFDQKSSWLQFGPFTGNAMNVKKLRQTIEEGAATLPTTYEGPIE